MSGRTRVTEERLSNDLIYYNIDITNTNTFDLGSNKDPVVSFQETRGTPILKDASQYNFSIVRFTLDGPNKNLPLFIPIILQGTVYNSNIGWQTIYSVTLVVKVGTKTATVQEPVYWLPERADIPRPVGPVNTQDVKNPYWWCSTIEYWLTLVNAALTRCHDKIQTAVSASTLYTLPPIITYDQNTNLFTLSLDSNGFGDNLTADLQSIAGFPSYWDSSINQDQRLNWSSQAPTSQDERFFLFFNSNMYGLFSNFDTLYLGDDFPVATDFGRDYLIVASNQRTASYNPLVLNPGGAGTVASVVSESTLQPDYYPRTLFIQQQEYESTSTLWSPVSSIVFCSTMLPTLPENVGQPFNVGSGDNNVNPATTSFTPIITDIGLPITSASDWRKQITYTPTAEYRFTSMGTSPQEVRAVDIQIFWKSRYTNELIPLRMFNKSSVSLKILFLGKSAPSKFQLPFV